MKKRIFIFGAIIVVAIFFYPQATIGKLTGSPGGKTGSPTDNTDCTQCHSGAALSTTSNITSNIPSSGYIPGNIYNITAVSNAGSVGPDPNGFEVTCEENTSNTKTGSFLITNSNTTQFVNNNNAVTHTAAGNSLNTWSFDWQAPVAGTGDITFYGAFIEAGYPMGSNNGDYFSSTTLSASEFIPPPLTYVPDDNFENYLEANGMGDGIALNDSVLTANINIVTNLQVGSQNIADLTGIEDFMVLAYLNCRYNQLTSLDVSNNTALTYLKCDDNQLTSLNISNNTALTHLECDGNQLTSLDVRNGNNINFGNFNTTNNPNLYCIDVDDVAWADTNWIVANGNIDSTMSFSTNCATAFGCTDPNACNYDALATIDDSSCIYGISSSSYDTLLVAASIVWNGNTLNVSGDYSDTLINSVGCDSIAYLNLTITNTTGLLDVTNTAKTLLKITDILGQETPYRRNTPLFYIYDDGTVEKRIVIE